LPEEVGLIGLVMLIEKILKEK